MTYQAFARTFDRFESRKNRSANITVKHLAIAVRVYCSFVDPGQKGRWGN